MTADFERMVWEAKTTHDLRLAQAAEQKALRKQERSRAVDKGVAAITSDVIPILEQAVAAFSKHGIRTKITRDFDVKEFSSKDPAIVFTCLTRVDGAQFEAPPAIFSSDGAVITVAVARQKHEREGVQKLGSALRGQSEDLVTGGVRRALDALFAEIEGVADTAEESFSQNRWPRSAA